MQLCGVCQCPSVLLFVTFVYCVKTSDYIVNIFSLFLYHTLRQYYDGDPLTGAKIAILDHHLDFGIDDWRSVVNNFDRAVDLT